MKQSLSLIKINSKKIFLSVSMLFIIIAAIISIQKSFALPTLEESIILQSENVDYESKEAGSWQVTKSVEWIEIGTAKVTLDLSTIVNTDTKKRDVAIVLDSSISMSGKMNQIKNATTNFIEKIIAEEDNKIALITFDSVAEIKSNFTSNKDILLEKISSITTKNERDYYQAFKKIDALLSDYKKENDKELIVLFIISGYSNGNQLNEIGYYQYLKNKYPYLTINTVQSDVNYDISNRIQNISDNQYIATSKNLESTLQTASVNPLVYDYFTISDYIDDHYFEFDNSKKISTTLGDAMIEDENSEQKIKWKFGNNLKSGLNAKMTFELSLKKEFLNSDNIFTTNKKLSIESLINDKFSENIVSNKTPTIANYYTVEYEENLPKGCNSSNNLEDKRYHVFDLVEVSAEKPQCDGYQFKGWNVVNKNIKQENQEYFVMPEEDVLLRAEWASMSIDKSVKGNIYKEPTLYEIIAANSVLDNISSKFVTSSTGINFSAAPSDTNGKGIYEMADTKNHTYPIYYYRGDITNNNLLFGNFCWKIVRTTSTGGIKIIYNGVPKDGTCNNTGIDSQIGLSSFNLSYNSPADAGYMYGTRYIHSHKKLPSEGTLFGKNFQYSGSTFTLENSQATSLWTESYNQINNNHYTCFNTTGKCTTLSYVYYTDNEYAYYINLTDGKSIDDALNEMFANISDSEIKKSIDTWYQNNMIENTKYLEDTIWCNDRSMSTNTNGWVANGGNTRECLIFTGYGGLETYNVNPVINCSDKRDSFTVSEDNGNGKLKYPVALLTAGETTLAGHGRLGYNSSSYLNTGQWWWTMSPFYIYNYYVSEDFVNFSGNLYDNSVQFEGGVRPSVSLSPGVKLADGDGSANNPYILKLEK